MPWGALVFVPSPNRILLLGCLLQERALPTLSSLRSPPHDRQGTAIVEKLLLRTCAVVMALRFVVLFCALTMPGELGLEAGAGVPFCPRPTHKF